MKCNRLIESFPWQDGYRIVAGECHIDSEGNIIGPLVIVLDDEDFFELGAEDLAALHANQAIQKMLGSVYGY